MIRHAFFGPAAIDKPSGGRRDPDCRIGSAGNGGWLADAVGDGISDGTDRYSRHVPDRNVRR
jgi:hypothetical protein